MAFYRAGEFAEKYFHQGMRVLVSGMIQTGSYINKDGQRVYTTDVIVDAQEFADGKAASEGNGGGYSGNGNNNSSVGDGFMNVPDGIDEELPFN